MATAEAPSWNRAKRLSGDMHDVGIDPIRQNRAALVHLLMAAPDPKAGTCFCSEMSEAQVRQSLLIR